MKKFFKVHYEKFLLFLTLLFSAAILGYFLWGGEVVVKAINRAIGVQPTQVMPVKFDIEGAAKLNLEKGQ